MLLAVVVALALSQAAEDPPPTTTETTTTGDQDDDQGEDPDEDPDEHPDEHPDGEEEAPAAPADAAAPAPPVVSDPGAVAPPPAPPPPAAPPSASPPAPAPVKKPPVARPPEGLDTWPTVALQTGAGTAVGCVSCCCASPLAALPVVGAFVWLGAAGALTATAETFVGDAVGQDRAALVWPVVTGASILVVGVAGFEASAYALGLPTTLDPNNPTVNLDKAGVPLAIVGVAAVAALVVPVVVYQQTAVPKEPRDHGGFSLPGFFAPADPTGTRASAESAPPAALPAPGAF